MKRFIQATGAVLVSCGLIVGVAMAQPAGPAPSGSANPAAGPAKPTASASASAKAKAGAPAPSASVMAKAGDAPKPAGSAPGDGAAKPADSSKPADTAAKPADSTAMDGQTYAVRLRDLEQKVDELKEQIRRSHNRLSMLSDTILSGAGGASRAVIKYKNELSDAFMVTRALFVLDGAVQYNKEDQSGALSDQPEIPIFNGSIPPGDHTLQVLINLQGKGYGVFSYLRGYKFEVRSNHSFTAVEGKTLSLDAISYEKGSVTTPIEERPAVRYQEKVEAGLAEQKAAGAPAPDATPAPSK